MKKWEDTIFLLGSVNQMQNSPKGGTKDEDGTF